MEKGDTAGNFDSSKRDFLKKAGAVAIGAVAVGAGIKPSPAEASGGEPQDPLYAKIKEGLSNAFEEHVWKNERVYTGPAPELTDFQKESLALLASAYPGDKNRDTIKDPKQLEIQQQLIADVSEAFKGNKQGWFDAGFGVVGISEDRKKVYIVSPADPWMLGYFDRTDANVFDGKNDHQGGDATRAHFQGDNTVKYKHYYGEEEIRGCFISAIDIENGIPADTPITVRRRFVRPNGNFDGLASERMKGFSDYETFHADAQRGLEPQFNDGTWKAWGLSDKAEKLPIQTEAKIERGHYAMPPEYERNTRIFKIGQDGGISVTNDMRGSALQVKGADWPQGLF